MTQAENVPAVSNAKPFHSLRIDRKRAEEGTWIRHPESDDQLRVRRLWCAEHIRAHEQATIDYEKQHGPGSAAATKEARDQVLTVGIATGLVVGWRIANDPDRQYDAAAMTALLLDPEYEDIRPWVLVESGRRDNFRPERLTGN